MTIQSFFFSVACASFGCLLEVSAVATPITYEFSATASGSLSNATFSKVALNITSTADTSQIEKIGNSVYEVDDLTATFTITGVGTGTFADQMFTVDNQGNPCVGISDDSMNLGIIFDNKSTFSSYNLGTPLGPISGTATYSSGSPIPTSAGNLTINSIKGQVTFQAFAPHSAPDGASAFGLLGLGLTALSAFGRKLQKAA